MPGAVTIALKHPAGLVLRLHDMVDQDELVMGGGSKTVKRAVLAPLPPVKVNGYAKKWDQPFPTDDKGNPVLLSGGYALTPNVDADFWHRWVKENADHDMVKNKLIFAMEKPDGAQGKAREQAALRSGLEPLAPNDAKDNRVPRGVKAMDTKEA